MTTDAEFTCQSPECDYAQPAYCCACGAELTPDQVAASRAEHVLRCDDCALDAMLPGWRECASSWPPPPLEPLTLDFDGAFARRVAS